MISPNVVATVGRTPLVYLPRFGQGLAGILAGKLEMRNPCGNVKDRVAVALIEDAERRGALRRGMTIVEATGGNTGIGLASAAAVKGYSLMLTMPGAMATERVALLKQFGVEIILTPGILMKDAIEKAEQIASLRDDVFYTDQFSNPANADIHRLTTGPEIWNDSLGAVDVFVSAVGTGGTISGVGEILKARKPSVRLVAVEPAGAAVLSGGQAGQHQMPGIGVGFIPRTLNRSIVDEVVVVSDEQAFDAARRLAREEGILAGVSAGAALHAAHQIANRPESNGKLVIVLLADTGERYISTKLFSS